MFQQGKDSDGATPLGGLIQASDGNFYGTTGEGGASDYGSVFRLTPAGSLTTIHSFSGPDGANPFSSLVRASDGNLYGTTSSGGASGAGTIFQLTPAGSLTTVYFFRSGGVPGAGSSVLFPATAGCLHGSMSQGQGSTGAGFIYRLCSQGPTSDVGGPYAVPAGCARISIQLDGTASFDPDGENLSFEWSVSCDGAQLDDATSRTPILTFEAGLPCFVCSVTLKVTDATGLSHIDVAEMVVNYTGETNPPVITCPAKVTVRSRGNEGSVVCFNVSATDSCDPNVQVSCSPASGSPFPIGTTPVTCTAVDANGNTATCSFNVIVTDRKPSFAFEGPAAVEGAPGERVDFDVFATLSTTGDEGGLGPNSWLLSFVVTGATLTHVTQDGIRADLIGIDDAGERREYHDVPLAELDFLAGAINGPSVSCDNPSIRGGLSAWLGLLSGEESRYLVPNGTQRIVRISIAATIPADGRQSHVALELQDGFRTAAGNCAPPNNNQVSYGGGDASQIYRLSDGLGASSLAIPLRTRAGGLQRPSDCNQDGTLDIADAICLLGHLFLGAPAAVPCDGGTIRDPGNIALLDANGGGGVDLSDAIRLLGFLFGGSAPPALGEECVPIAGCPDNGAQCEG